MSETRTIAPAYIVRTYPDGHEERYPARPVALWCHRCNQLHPCDDDYRAACPHETQEQPR